MFPVRIMRISVICQPSADFRCQEIRDMRPASSVAWQLPHAASTRGLVTGMPSCAAAGIASPRNETATSVTAVRMAICHGTSRLTRRVQRRPGGQDAVAPKRSKPAATKSASRVSASVMPRRRITAKLT